MQCRELQGAGSSTKEQGGLESRDQVTHLRPHRSWGSEASRVLTRGEGVRGLGEGLGLRKGA